MKKWKDMILEVSLFLGTLIIFLFWLAVIAGAIFLVFQKVRADAIYGHQPIIRTCDDLAYLPASVPMPPEFAAMKFIGPPEPPKLMPLPVAPGTNQFQMSKRADLVRRALIRHRSEMIRQKEGRDPIPVVVPIDALPLLP